MEQELKQNLRVAAQAYSAAKGIGLPTLGRLAAGDWRFFDRLAGGKTFTARKYDEVMRWFAKNWPRGVPWPAGCKRPSTRPGRTRIKRAA